MSPPSSLAWRRSPSYEQLLQITLPPIAENLVPERRVLTLSYTGSDTTFGEDSQLGELPQCCRPSHKVQPAAIVKPLFV